MRKILTAILILTALFALSLYNAGYYRSKIAEICELIDASAQAKKSGSSTEAIEIAREAEKRWEMLETYHSIFIRHSEVDSASEMLYEYVMALDNNSAEKSGHRYLIDRLYGLSNMERPGLGSIF